MTRRRIIMVCGVIAGLGLMAFILLAMDGEKMLESLHRLRPAPLPFVLFFFLASTATRALRWSVLLAPCSPFCPAPRRGFLCWHALCVGYFGNFILPARAGEFIRIFHIHRTLGAEMGAAASISVMDRMLDVCCLILLGMTLSATLAMERQIPGMALPPMMLALAMAIACLALAVLSPQKARALLEVALHPLPLRLREPAAKFGCQALEAACLAGSAPRLCLALLLSIGAFAADVGISASLFRTMGWSLPLEAALAMELGLCAASSLPSAPGYLGLYQVAAVFVLGRFGLPAEEAVAFALILQAFSLAFYGLTGASGFLAFRRANEKHRDMECSRNDDACHFTTRKNHGELSDL